LNPEERLRSMLPSSPHQYQGAALRAPHRPAPGLRAALGRRPRPAQRWGFADAPGGSSHL